MTDRIHSADDQGPDDAVSAPGRDGVSDEVALFIRTLSDGGEAALGDLFAAAYGELHRLAHGQRVRWNGQETLSTTVLVHEVYLKLSEQSGLKWEDRAHFFRVAARAMRHILINYAKRSRRIKRGGDCLFVPLDEVSLIAKSRLDELLALDEALTRLEELSPRRARVVECRFFAGLEVEETAEALGISIATVMRDWSRGKAWLARMMNVV